MSDPIDAIPSSIPDLMRFLDVSPTAFHAASEVEQRLSSEGFAVLDEKDAWKMEPRARYLVVRGGSAVVAIVAGTKPVHTSGVRVIGAHTDSPALKLKPNAAGVSGGYVTFGLEVYGGPVLATWVDRDLMIAGRVAVSDDATPMGVGSRLVSIDRPLVFVPGLAIHLDRKVNDEGLRINAQDNLPALYSLDAGDPVDLRAVVSEHLGMEPKRILAWDLFLVDAQHATLAGARDAFIRSGRLDDLAMCHAGLTALLRTCDKATPHARMVVLYDHEEVGSATSRGAVSPLLADVLERLALSGGGGREDYMRAVQRSLFVSADMAHALNPNHASRHDDRHRPLLNGGPVLKVNASMRYATDATGWALFEKACAKADVPVQRYVNRSDIPSGSTIGPIASSRLGMMTLDIGNPMLSMHSIRETAGTRDHELMIRAMTELLSGE